MCHPWQKREALPSSIVKVRFHLQTLKIYKLGFNQNHFTLTSMLLMKSFSCSELSWCEFINNKCCDMRFYMYMPQNFVIQHWTNWFESQLWWIDLNRRLTPSNVDLAQISLGLLVFTPWILCESITPWTFVGQLCRTVTVVSWELALHASIKKCNVSSCSTQFEPYDFYSSAVIGNL